MKPTKGAKLGLAEVYKTVPTRAPAVETERVGDEMAIMVRRNDTRLARVLSWFFVLPKSKRFSLDRRGIMVWELCDGRRNVEEIIRKFGEAEKLDRASSEPPVLQFLTMLSGRRLVSFMAPGAGGSAPNGRDPRQFTGK